MALDSYILDNGELNDLNVSFKDVLNPQCRVQFTDNVSSINVLSTTGRDDLLYANIGSNVQEIQASCFINQSQLQAVTGSAASLLAVGDAAFKDCTALTSISFIDNAHGLNFIGASAFMNTGLEKAKVYMSGPTGYALVMDAYAFANNTQLKEVEIVGGNFLGDYEFAGCTALTAVKMPNRHSFSGRYSFKDCSSLANVTIPASTYELNVGLFEGCSSLTSITFNEPSELHFARCLQNNFLNGTAITSLTLPASITSYAFINNYAFANIPYLKQIRFNGLKRDQIAIGGQSESIGVQAGVIYSTRTSYLNNNYSIASDPTYFVEVSKVDSVEKQNICLQNGIPIIWFGYSDGCSRCKGFARSIVRSTDFLNWVKSKNNKYCIFESNTDEKIRNISLPGNALAFVCLFWRKYAEDGTYVDYKKGIGHVGSSSPWKTPSDFISFIENSDIAAYDGSGTAIEVISADIYNTNCFGLNHNVMLFGNDSEQPVPFEYKGDGELPSIIFEQSIYTDKHTVNNFKYGQWYYNAKELREYADKYHLPVFLELGSIKCGPCTDFQTFVFLNPEFQKLMTQSYQILLCRLGEETQFTAGQPDYVMQQWFDVSWSTLHNRMPLLMFYWKQSEEKTHYVYAHFNSEADESFPNLPLVYNYESVKEWLETKCFPLLNTEPAYTPSAQFNMPEVFELSALSAYPRYKMYANQSDDTYGRYFPTVRLEPVVHGLDDFYTISVQNAAGVLTQYFIDSTKTTGLPPQGTYQYFTSLSNADTLSSWYEANYDISGIIFKVGQDNIFANVPNKTLTCSPGVCALTSYLDNVGLSGSMIASQTSAFNAEIYVYDGENGWSTSISPDFRPIYNAKLTYSANGLDAAELTGIAKIEVYASADVEINEIGQIGFKQDAQLSVLSACYYVPTSTTAKVVWLSTFYNFEESIV